MPAPETMSWLPALKPLVNVSVLAPARIIPDVRFNVPVLTSNRSSMPEVAGNAALLIDPDEPASIAKGLDELLGDDDLRNVLRASGMARVASFTWERCARQTSTVLKQAYGSVGG